MGLVNPEYDRKLCAAKDLAELAYERGGLDEMRAELAWWRRQDGDAVIIAEIERLYHRQVVKTAERGEKYW